MGRRGGGGMRGGGMRGGSGRIGGGLSGGSGRIGGGGRAGIGSPMGRPAPRVSTPRINTPRVTQPRRGGGFGMGVATGMLLGGGRRRSMWGWGGGFGRRTVVHHHHGGGPMRSGGGGGGGCGCFTMILAVFLLVILLALLGSLLNFGMPGGGQVTRSTVRREALPRNERDSSSPLIVDDGWIPNHNAARAGMHNFQNATGVRPILYVTNDINGVFPTTESQLQDYARTLYPRLTDDHTNVLLLFVVRGDEEYAMYVQAGDAVLRIMDEEARNILMDYVERFWRTERDRSQMFSRSFDQAGSRIMTVHRSPWVTVLVVAGVLLILFLLYTWWKAKRDQKNLEFEQTQEILNTNLTEFGSSTPDEASRLAQQYQDDDNQN